MRDLCMGAGIPMTIEWTIAFIMVATIAWVASHELARSIVERL